MTVQNTEQLPSSPGHITENLAAMSLKQPVLKTVPNVKVPSPCCWLSPNFRGALNFRALSIGLSHFSNLDIEILSGIEPHHLFSIGGYLQ